MSTNPRGGNRESCGHMCDDGMKTAPMRPADSARTHVWLLLGDKAGDNAQLRVLAAGLNVPVVEKPLTFNRLYRIPNVLLGATLSSVAAGRDELQSPWPDLILASGRRSVPVARWIKQQSSGRTKLVHLGRTW